MKKKMISLLMTALIMVSLVCAITVSAYAEPTVTFVTVAQGDTVVGICKKYGVDYYSYKNLIMALNGVSSESDFSKIKIGSNFAVPISDAAAKALANCSASVTPGEKQTVSFNISEEMLKFLRADMTFGTEPGEFRVFIGHSSACTDYLSFRLK